MPVVRAEEAEEEEMVDPQTQLRVRLTLSLPKYYF